MARADIVRKDSGDVIPDVEAAQTFAKQAQADVAIDYAKRVKDWPLLEDAVDAKLKDQAEFVRWWQARVSPRHRPPGGKPVNADRGLQLLAMPDAEAQTQIRQQQVSKWKRRLAEPEKYRAMLYGAAYHQAMAEDGRNYGSGEIEWYTPTQHVEAVRAVLGAIELDPASNPIAQEVVQAAEWYGEQENGLTQEWHGRVFLNPPYKFPLISEFTGKLVSEFLAGNVPAAILLTNNATDTRWWHEAARAAAAICFTFGRVNFYQADGEPQKQNTNGQTFFYYGTDRNSFASTFGVFGLVLEPTA